MNFKALAAASTLLMSAHMAQAGLLTTFTGVGAAGTTAEANFRLALTTGTLRTDSLEDLASGIVSPIPLFTPDPLSTPINDWVAKLSGPNVVTSNGAATGGRHAKDGNLFWQAGADPFTIEFAQAVAAFGFWGSDIGDFINDGCSTCSFTGVLRIRLDFAGGANAPAARTFDLMGDAGQGSDMFWGFADSTGAKVTKVTFTNLTGGIDGQGFDLFQIGDVAVDNTNPNPTPEPGMLALAGLGLAGVAAARRRRK